MVQLLPASWKENQARKDDMLAVWFAALIKSGMMNSHTLVCIILAGLRRN